MQNKAIIFGNKNRCKELYLRTSIEKQCSPKNVDGKPIAPANPVDDRSHVKYSVLHMTDPNAEKNPSGHYTFCRSTLSTDDCWETLLTPSSHHSHSSITVNTVERSERSLACELITC